MSVTNLALRIDDIGASSKVHEIYSKNRFLNIGVLRDRRLFGAWGPYREIVADEWLDVIKLLKRFGAKLTVGVTASWVNFDGSLHFFHEKFPDIVSVLRSGVNDGVLEIANHGLTHCVLSENQFRPGIFGSNRTYHREFWDWIPREVHFEHVSKSQSILEEAFGKRPQLLIPPGNVFAVPTLEAAVSNGINRINCNNPCVESFEGLKILDNSDVVAFHDRELVLFGLSWLENVLENGNGQNFVFVSEL